MKRSIPLIAAVLLSGAAVAPAARADALEVFKTMIEPALNQGGGTTTYDAKATGPSSFILSNIVYTPETGGDAPHIKIASLEVQDVDLDGIQGGDMPRRLKLRVTGFAIDPTALQMLPPEATEVLGSPPPKVNLVVDFNVDAQGALKVKEASLELAGLAKLQVVLDISGLPPAGTPLSAMDPNQIVVRHAGIILDDTSLLSRLIPVAARSADKTPEAAVAEAVAAMKAQAAQQSPADQAMAATLVSFLQDYKRPKGPLQVSFDPPGGMGADGMQKVMMQGPAALGAKITYTAR